ncbi:MAG: HDIG domain-containing protein [Acidobacteria bacterium]|nr:HDIG domain-containing protein [Acidobacteriota bacterium]MCW5948877.1 HDIG domain-containing protein [Pyrinomonadaceae bacterium]
MSKRIRDLRSPGTALKKSFFDAVSKPFARLSPGVRSWIGFSLLCIATTLCVHNPLWRSGAEQKVEAGDVASESITSPADIYFVDENGTEALREQARRSVKPIFRYESNKAEQAVQRFVSSWEKLQRATDGGKNSNAGESRGAANWTGADGADVSKVLANRSFSRNEIDAVRTAIREASDGYIYDDSERQYFQREVAVFDRSRPNQSTVVTLPESSWTPLSAAREKFQARLRSIRTLSQKELEAMYSAGSLLIEPSVSYDSVATEMAQQNAAEKVEPITVSLRRGEKIVEAGWQIKPEMVPKIAAVNNYSSSTRQLNRFFGLLAFITALYWVAWKFIQHRGVLPRLALSADQTFALLGFIVLSQTVIMAVLFRLVEFTALQNIRPPMNDPAVWSLAIPFAAGSLLMTLLADRPTALFTGFLLAIIGGFMAPKGLEFAVFAALTSSVSVYGIGRYRSRQTVTLAGGLIGIAGALLGLAMMAFSQQPIVLNSVLLSVACGLAGGLITAALTGVLLPICETLFGILTDVKLLELSNADLPVLGQLALRAPGTNQHSHAVGQLAEEACRVVGANGLLARIGALYHDIGKTAAPEHFVENQLNKNPHDRLKPSQSAKIIIAHVTYGVKLAREMGLPQRIIDFIPQHHGTRTLHYFLKKAQSEARPDEIVSERDFRYPGPKPQFKEAAIMMIADSCEAAARSLADPTPENIRFIVTKIIDAILTDDQLDECDLTLRELTKIREAMIRSLVAIYHSRVDYPGYVPPTSGQFRIAGEMLTPVPAGNKYDDPADIPVSPGGEIEDEAIDRTTDPTDGSEYKSKKAP